MSTFQYFNEHAKKFSNLNLKKTRIRFSYTSFKRDDTRLNYSLHQSNFDISFLFKKHRLYYIETKFIGKYVFIFQPKNGMLGPCIEVGFIIKNDCQLISFHNVSRKLNLKLRVIQTVTIVIYEVFIRHGLTFIYYGNSSTIYLVVAI